MALTTLPKELLLMVTDHLPIRSIEALALTLNQQITPLCLPLLQPLFARRARIKRLNQLFGDFWFNPPLEISDLEDEEGCLEKLGILAITELTEPAGAERLRRLEYLDLKEDLHWLKPLNERTAASMRHHHTHTALGADELAALEADAKSVNITLPSAFVKFFTDWELIIRIPSCSANYFRIEGGLRKVRSAVDNGAGGYSLSIYSDQQGCGYWTLYLEPGPEGYHCVLSSSFDSGMDWEDFSDGEQYDASGEQTASGAKREMSHMSKGDISLEGISFEEWLAMTYYEQQLWYVCHDYGEPNEDLKEYVRKIYVEAKP